MFSRIIDNTSSCGLNNKNISREVTVKIGLKIIDIQEGVTVEVLFDSGAESRSSS